MSYDVFIATKPFQWINVENIPKDNVNNVLIIVQNFPNAQKIAKNIQKEFPYWKEIKLVKNRLQAFLYSQKFNVRNLYVDSDYGRKSYIYCLTKGNLYVYDEGIGTYSVTTLNTKTLVSRIKYILFSLIGAGTFQGGNWKTKGVFLHNPEYYKLLFADNIKKLEVYKFKVPYHRFVEENIEKISRVFEYNSDNNFEQKKILLYITFHTLRKDIIDFINIKKSEYDFVFIKPHPHLLKFGDLTSLNEFTIIDNPVIAELIIIKLSLKNQLTVIHESSSACLNLDINEKLNIIDFKNPLFEKEFDKYFIYRITDNE